MSGKVLIVGGGAFGLSAAISLRKRGYEVLLIDQSDLPCENSSSYDINKMVRSDYGKDSFYTELAIKAINEW
jgi:glycine/D-amino acid oxidase-like deaminating enzyme